jgi:NAD dependent epimerase/dehydratase
MMKKKDLAKTKVLVTGAGGFIGSHLCEAALSHGAQVRAFVHYNSRNDWGMLEDLEARQLREIEVVAGDLRDPDAVRRAVQGCHVVFHLGALIGIPYSYANPADVVATNVLGTLHVLQAGLEAGVLRLVQTSTSEVYGTAQFVPMDEGHPLHPQSPYAASKVASDKLAESYCRTYGLPVVIVRPFNCYGPRQSPRAVIPAIITQALESSSLRLGRLDPRRDFTYVLDTVRGFVAAATTPGCVGETIQLGSAQEISITEIVHLVGSILGRKLRIVSETRRRRPETSEVERLFAANRKAAELLHWQPRVSLLQGLQKTIEWFQSQTGRYKHHLYNV